MCEDEPMEHEVAIDPEMLGKVFENLLEVRDRKSKGVLNLGKMVPGIGAVVGGVFDFSETKIIGNRAIKMFFDGDLMLNDDKSVVAFEDVDEVAEAEVEDLSSEEVIDCAAPNA